MQVVITITITETEHDTHIVDTDSMHLLLR